MTCTHRNPISAKDYKNLETSSKVYLSNRMFDAMTPYEAFSLIRGILVSFTGALKKMKAPKHFAKFRTALDECLQYLSKIREKSLDNQTRQSLVLLLKIVPFLENDVLAIRNLKEARVANGYYCVLRAVVVIFTKLSGYLEHIERIWGDDGQLQHLKCVLTKKDQREANFLWAGYGVATMKCPLGHDLYIHEGVTSSNWTFVAWDLERELGSGVRDVLGLEAGSKLVFKEIQKIFGPTPRQSRQKLVRDHKLTLAEQKRLSIELCQDEDLTYPMIAKKIGASAANVRMWCLKAGVRKAQRYSAPAQPWHKGNKIKRKEKTQASKSFRFCPRCMNTAKPGWIGCPYCGYSFRRNPEIPSLSDAFQKAINGPPGEVSGFIIIQAPEGTSRDYQLDAFCKESHQRRYSWDWREWNSLINNPPIDEYFLCIEDTTLENVDALMGGLSQILRKEPQKWKIAFQRIGKVPD